MKHIIVISILAFAVLAAGCDLSDETSILPVEEFEISTITSYLTLVPIVTTETSRLVITGNRLRPDLPEPIYDGTEGRLFIYIKVKPANANWEVTWTSDNNDVFFDKATSQIMCTGPGDAKLTFTTVGKTKDGEQLSKVIFVRSTVTKKE